MRADGRYEAKGTDPITGRRKSFYSWISQADADAKAGKTPPPLVREPSLWQYYSHNYVPTVGHRSENWRQQIAWAMDRHIRPYIGGRRLSEIDRPLLQQWANALCRRVSPSSAAKVKIELRHTFISLMELEVEAPRAIVEELAGKAKGGNSAAYLHPSAAVKLRWMERLWTLVMGCEVEGSLHLVRGQVEGG